jgi:hypothetical protein
MDSRDQPWLAYYLQGKIMQKGGHHRGWWAFLQEGNALENITLWVRERQRVNNIDKRMLYVDVASLSNEYFRQRVERHA